MKTSKTYLGDLMILKGKTLTIVSTHSQVSTTFLSLKSANQEFSKLKAWKLKIPKRKNPIQHSYVV